MTIKFIPPERHRDYIGALTAVLSAAAGVYTLNPFSTSAQASNIWKAFKGVETATPENLAWVWLNATITLAANEFLAFIARENELMLQARDGAVEAFLKAAIPEEITAEFNDGALRSPVTHEAFQPARKAIIAFVLALTRITLFDEETSQKERYQREFDRHLNRASAYVFSAHYDRLKPLETAVTGPATEAMRREAAWARHYDWIHRKVDTEPVFSPDGTVTTPLKPLYLRPRAYWHELLREDDEAGDKSRYRAHLGDLHQTLEDWLATDDAKGMNTLRLIAGGPGSGKSSFAKVFASESILRERYRVIFVELQHMRSMTGELLSDLTSYLKRRPPSKVTEGTPGLPDNALQWASDENRPLLLIFDGLDELSFVGDHAAELTRKFILSVRQMLITQNAEGTWLRALVLGRNAAIQSGMREADIPMHLLLNVAPIRKLTQDDLKPPRYSSPDERRDKCEFPDLSRLPSNLTRDQRPAYWLNWAKAQGEIAPTPKAVTDESLSDLNVEPLLLHLLILSDYCGEQWKEAAENRNLVYEDILAKVYRRNAEKPNNPRAWSEDQFFHLMEALGIAAWRGNGRAGTEATFDAVCKRHARHLFKGASGPQVPDMDSVILQTHARPIDGPDAGFEFIHKSFGEYLVARGLVTAAIRLHKRWTSEANEEEESYFALIWAELVRDAALTAAALGATSKPWNTQRSNGWIGSTTVACLNQLGTSRRQKQRPISTKLWKLKPWPRN
ncbi:hypothetical protein C8J27_104193 [Rhodobacter aestuarii]|uniref:NACHT domain-containing protein n=1 Tax=Rhodobacter aestuarii TaxID=453582 RepID=A0A1N7KUW9_9RHOB|nr:hypothetical protein C8J27_104193 [Rhodobacter aestuarii]SIS65399.1 hypothetical protein SAMN05421580_10361 [Rhodobacter aestuarii]